VVPWGCEVVKLQTVIDHGNDNDDDDVLESRIQAKVRASRDSRENESHFRDVLSFKG
jgi:hypothetical protein